MTQPYWSPEPYGAWHRQRLGLGAGAALGVLVGVLGPIVIALVVWGLTAVLPTGSGSSLVGLAILAIIGLPLILVVLGAILMISDEWRGWGVAALTASGVWLISSAGVCTVAFFGAMSSYDNSGMMLL